MTNLEYTEKAIKVLKKDIDFMKKVVDESNKFPTIKKIHEENLKCMEKQLQTVQQIKAKLEAWEVVKKKITILRGEIIGHILYVKKRNGALTHEEY